MPKRYIHISPEEYAVIMINDQKEIKAAKTAKLLGRHRSHLQADP